MSALWDSFVSHCMMDRSLAARFRDLVTASTMEDSVLGVIWDLVLGFFDEYKRMPTRDELLLRMDSLPGSEQSRRSRYEDRVRSLCDSPPSIGSDVIASEVVEAVKRHQITELLLEGGRMVDARRVDYDRLLNGMRSVLSIGDDDSLGTELGQDIPSLINRITAEEVYESIPSGLSGLDSIIGGWRKGQLACGMAASGVGKSTFLVNHAVAAATGGRNVLLLTVELDEDAVIERVVRRIGKLERKSLQGNKAFAERWMGRFFDLTDSRFVVRYARPGRFGVEDLEGYLDRMSLVRGFSPDVIYIDYLDEMRAGSDDRRKDVRHQHSGVTRDLIGLAKSRYIAVVTMTQTNRDAIGKKKLTMKDVGEDYGKIKQGDVTFAICQTDDEYRQGQARVRILKNRDGPGVGREVPVLIDYKTMTVKSLGVRGGDKND